MVVSYPAASSNGIEMLVNDRLGLDLKGIFAKRYIYVVL